MINTTLCYLERGEEYLMLHRTKKENDLNHDKWIGVGGKFQDKESPEDCLLRETWEETGLTLTSYRYRGLVTFISMADRVYASVHGRRLDGGATPLRRGRASLDQKGRSFVSSAVEGRSDFSGPSGPEHAIFLLEAPV